MSEKLYISVEKAYELVVKRDHDKAILKFPYKVRYKNENAKLKNTDSIPLIFLMNAITLNNLKHPETEDIPQSIDIKSIISCYLMGSAVKPTYEKITKKYLFGLYTSEKNQRVIPNDIDILCLTCSTHILSHIKSMTSWKITINNSYGGYNVSRYANFDISFYPVSYMNHVGNDDFIKHIEDHGVCIMGKNMINAKKYACWHHDTIKDKIVCNIPKTQNITKEQIIEEQNEEITRFELIDWEKHK